MIPLEIARRWEEDKEEGIAAELTKKLKRLQTAAKNIVAGRIKAEDIR